MFALGWRIYGYRTVSGRSAWPSRDPIAEKGGMNLFGCVKNNPINHYDPLGLSWQISIGGGGLIGGNPYGPIDQSPFWTLSLSVGLSFDQNGLQLFIQSQNSSLTGFGMFAGGGITGGISHSDCPLKTGKDTGQHVEANIGLVDAAGLSGDYSDNSGGIGFPIPKLDIGVGAGSMLANGTSTTYTFATPVIGFSPPTGTVYTPITYINSPPTTWTP